MEGNGGNADVVVHDYADLIIEDIWKTVVNDIPKLKEEIKKIKLSS